MMDTESLFEQWRWAVSSEQRVSARVRQEVWQTAMDACCSLLKRKARIMTSRMSKEELYDLRTEVTMMFLEFIRDNPTKPIGYLFKTFMLRFPDVLTRVEAKKIGLGLKSNKAIVNCETTSVRKVLERGRKGEAIHPIISSLQVGSVPFEDALIEQTETGEFRYTGDKSHGQ